MLLVEKKRITEQQIDANVIITALEEDKLSVTELMTEFNVVGLNYIFLTKGKSVQNDFWYWRTCEENLRRAGCLVVVMSRAFFAEENKARRDAFWYEVGVMEARGQSVIPYMLDIERSEWDGFLTKTPIRQKQATGDVSELIRQIEETRVFKKSFFANRDIAYFGNARVFYSELSVILNIRKEVVDGILERLKLLDDDEIETRGDVLELLHKELNFGIRLHRFGKSCFTEHPLYSAYVAEAEMLNMDCTPINSYNRFTLLSQNLNNGSYAVKVDFILPNHEVFGVAFKPYIEVGKNSAIRKGDLLKLLEQESTREIYEEKLDATVVPTEKTQRVYFNLYFDDDQMLVGCDDGEIGKTCNFVYAK